MSLHWLWSQHNEHRPVVSRLIMISLYRFIALDFRVGLYANAALISATAASMIVLVRRLRGHTNLVDVTLPLSILNLAQAETLLLGLAMALMLTSWVSCELLRLASARDSHVGWRFDTEARTPLVAFALVRGRWSESCSLLFCCGWHANRFGAARAGKIPMKPSSRSIGVVLLVVCLAVVALYIVGYKRPPNHPLPISIAAIASTFLEYLSLAIWPIVAGHCRPAGLIVAFLIAATLARLVLGRVATTSRESSSIRHDCRPPCHDRRGRGGWDLPVVHWGPGWPLRHDHGTAFVRHLCRLVGSWIGSSPTTRARFAIFGGGSDGSGEYQVWAQGRSPA